MNLLFLSPSPQSLTIGNDSNAIMSKYCSLSFLYVPGVPFNILYIGFYRSFLDICTTKNNKHQTRNEIMLIGLIIAVLLLAYLIYTLIKPEKF